MATLVLRAAGPASVALVWQRYADPRRWSGWSPQIVPVDAGGATRITTGLRGRVWSVVGMSVPFEVLAVDEAVHSWTWRVGVGRAVLRLTHEVGPPGGGRGGGASTVLRAAGPWPLLAAYAPLARLALRRLVR